MGTLGKALGCAGAYLAASRDVVDMLINGVQVVSMDGSVETLHRNGDTDGADGGLDEPCELLVDGDRLVVINMDWWFECEWLTNTKTDQPFTVSVIDLKK